MHSRIPLNHFMTDHEAEIAFARRSKVMPIDGISELIEIEAIHRQNARKLGAFIKHKDDLIILRTKKEDELWKQTLLQSVLTRS